MCQEKGDREMETGRFCGFDAGEVESMGDDSTEI